MYRIKSQILQVISLKNSWKLLQFSIKLYKLNECYFQQHYRYLWWCCYGLKVYFIIKDLTSLAFLMVFVFLVDMITTPTEYNRSDKKP